MERVVLKFRGIKMSTCMFINSIFTNNSLEISESKEVRITPTWCNKCASNTWIWKLVISLEHKWRCEIWLLTILKLSFYFLFNVTKTLIHCLIKHFRINLSCSRNNNIITYIMFSMKLFNLISSNRINIISYT